MISGFITVRNNIIPPRHRLSDAVHAHSDLVDWHIYQEKIGQTILTIKVIHSEICHEIKMLRRVVR